MLQYRPALKRWVFGLTTEDADTAPLVYASSLLPPKLNQWTHLTGVYDHPARQVRLYVDGQLVGTKKDVGMWRANNGFTIGRGRANGQPVDFFPGALDEVQTDQWAVPADEIVRRATWPAPVTGQLGRYISQTGDHYTGSTATPPRAGYRFEFTLGTLVATEQPSTHLLYACADGADSFTSKDAACEGKVKLGDIGRVYTQQPTNLATVPVYRCNDNGDRFESRHAECEGKASEGLLGYTVGYATLTRYAFTYDHWSTVDGTRPGYKYEGPQGQLALTAEAGTTSLMSCLDDGDQFLSLEANCEGKQVIGSAGRIWTAAPAGGPSRQLYRCLLGTQRFISTQANCEGLVLDRPLGYVLVNPPTTAPIFG